MPVRKIPKNYRSVTGRFPSLKNGRSIAFESTLERDFFLTLEFDNSVKYYEEQPVTISGEKDGRPIKFTPDCHITYRDGSEALYEIKYTTDLEKDADELSYRFAAAEQYAKDKGMEFRIATELDIRGQRLDNLRFIYGFSSPPRILESIRPSILQHLTKPLPLKVLLDSLSPDRLLQATYIPVIWHLVFAGALHVDMNLPLNNKTILQVNHGSDTP